MSEPIARTRIEEIRERLKRALMDAWLCHPGTKPGEWGKPNDVFFSVEKAVEALAPVIASALAEEFEAGKLDRDRCSRCGEQHSIHICCSSESGR